MSDAPATPVAPAVGRDLATDFRVPVAALALTTAVAGLADGVAFLGYATFVANQSGNVILIGLGAAGRYSGWHSCVAAILGFVVGAVAGRLTDLRLRGRGRYGAVVGIVVAAAMFAAWAAVAAAVPLSATGRSEILSVIGAVPMGWLSATFARTAGISTATTYMTGTTLQTTVAATDAVRDGADRRARRMVALGATAVGCYGGGAALGAAMWRGDAGLVVVCAPALLLLLVLVRRPWSG